MTLDSDPKFTGIKSGSFEMNLDAKILDTNTFMGDMISDDIYLSIQVND